MGDLKLVSLLIVNVLSNIWYSVLVPFLPLEFHKLNLDAKWFGYIFAMYAVAVIIGSLIVGKLLTLYGRKNILLMGLTCMGLAMIGFGAIEYISHRHTLIIVSLAMRFWQGFACSSIQTTSYSIISITYTEDKQKYIGYIESSVGFGLLIGPAVGSALYILFGFGGTFYTLGLLLILWAPSLYFIIPRSVDVNDLSVILDQETASNGESYIRTTENLKPIKYCDALKNSIFTLTAIAAFMASLQYCYADPVLALRVNEFDVDPFFVGLFFCFNATSYTIMWFIVPILTKYFDNKTLIVSGWFMTGLAHLLVGPSVFLPNSLVIMCIGQFLFGGLQITFIITPLPEMIKQLQNEYPGRDYEASDISAGILNAMFGLGEMLGPIYGSIVTEYFGFRLWADTIAYQLIAFSIVYFMWLRFHPSQKTHSKIAEEYLELKSNTK